MTKKNILIEPLTRIEGHLAIHAEADLDAKTYTDAHSYGTMFRGFEKILQNREPADAIWITQRLCGVCPVPHATASALAVDMAYNVSPPPMAIGIRNLVLGSEELYDSPLGCIILEGPDYSRSVVRSLNPDWWKEAQNVKAENAAKHGYATIADIMTALNPITGSMWVRSLQIEKLGRKMASIFGAKHPHVQTFIPGGISYTLNPSDLEKFAAILAQQIAFTKEFVPFIDDLFNFLIKMGYETNGTRPTNLYCNGMYEDPLAYDAKYENMSNWAEKRKCTPGMIINGELITTDLLEINLGIREFVSHSYYDDWDGQDIQTDPLGNDVAREHPWNKDTNPAPGPMKAWESKYSWGTSPRWHDWKNRTGGGMHVVEVGPLARMWVTSMAKKVPESTGTSLRFTLPRATSAGYPIADEVTFDWKIPAKINSIERIRARAYFHAYSAYVVYNQLLQAFELVKGGKTDVWTKYKRPKNGIGVGLTEAMRGAVGHWVVMRKGKIHRYQIIAPTGWNAGPRGPEGRMGPYEEAIMDTPITETSPSDEWKGVDVVRIIRSYDPCLACNVHVFDGSKNLIIKRDLWGKLC